MTEDVPRKRSRFDQTEPEARKPSRFDRRSRSPSARQSESRRSRSPLRKETNSPNPGSKSPASKDPAAAAAAAAAKIQAELQARRGIQHVDVPPIMSTASPTSTAPDATTTATGPSGQSLSKLDGEIYIADGDYIKDIEINDLRNRYTLTKGSTQKMGMFMSLHCIDQFANDVLFGSVLWCHPSFAVADNNCVKQIKDETGSDVTTRGSYYPDKSMATAANPPLYLHITSTSKEGLEQAISKIEDLMQQELPNLVDERRFKKREPDVERDEFGRRKWPEAKIPIDMENIPGFNLRAQVVGQGGAYVKHIQQETRCRVQIKGRGSAFLEHSTNQESDEPMYLHVASPDAEAVEKAKSLCEDLLASVRANYEHFKANPPPQRMESYTDGYGADAQRGSYGGGYGRDRGRDSYSGGHGHNNNNHNNNNNYGGYNSSYSGTPPTQATAAGVAGSPSADQYAQYAQYYANQPGGDPYAAYGGYQAYMQAYYQYYQQQQQQQPPQAGTQLGQEGAAPPPPPPPDSNGPPPPPADNQGYNSVPPPPGM